MHERYPESGWDELRRQVRPEVAVRATDGLIGKVELAIETFKSETLQASGQRHEKPNAYEREVWVDRLPLLPIHQRKEAGQDLLFLLGIDAISTVDNLSAPFSYELSGGVTGVPYKYFVEAMRYSAVGRIDKSGLRDKFFGKPDGGVKPYSQSLFSEREIAKLHKGLQPDKPEQTNSIAYLDTDGVIRPLTVEDMTELHNDLDVYIEQVKEIYSHPMTKSRNYMMRHIDIMSHLSEYPR